MDSIIDFKSGGLMHETKNFKKKTALHSNESASFRRQAWSNTQWFPGMGVQRLSPDSCNMGDSINKLYIAKNSFWGMPKS